MFGGYGPGALSDTWEYDGVDWTQRQPTTSPPWLVNHGTVFDSRRGVTVVFGGMSNWRNVNDTWEWDGTDWAQRSPANSPSPRENCAIAFDPVRGVTVLFGGEERGVTSYDDTWEWDGVNWAQPVVAARPSSRAKTAMCFDAQRSEAILFGGSAGSGGQVFNDTWRYGQRSASYTTYRLSCPGSVGTPQLRAGLPLLGQPWTLTVDNLAANTAGYLIFTLGDRQIGLNRLPLDMTFLGAPGCFVNVEIGDGTGAVSLLLPSDSTRVARANVGIPAGPAVLGFRFFNQYVSLDAPSGRPFRITTTNAGRGVVGL